MEEQLRNGIALAKLVRVFQGEGAVRRIYEVRAMMLIELRVALTAALCRHPSWTSDTLITSTTSSSSCATSVSQRYVLRDRDGMFVILMLYV